MKKKLSIWKISFNEFRKVRFWLLTLASLFLILLQGGAVNVTSLAWLKITFVTFGIIGSLACQTLCFMVSCQVTGKHLLVTFWSFVIGHERIQNVQEVIWRKTWHLLWSEGGEENLYHSCLCIPKRQISSYNSHKNNNGTKTQEQKILIVFDL